MLSKRVMIVDELPVFKVDTKTIIDGSNSQQGAVRERVTSQLRLKIPGSGAKRRCAVGWNPVQRREVTKCSLALGVPG